MRKGRWTVIPGISIVILGFTAVLAEGPSCTLVAGNGNPRNYDIVIVPRFSQDYFDAHRGAYSVFASETARLLLDIPPYKGNHVNIWKVEDLETPLPPFTNLEIDIHESGGTYFDGRVVRTTIYNYRSMPHEISHACGGLADEYPGGNYGSGALANVQSGIVHQPTKVKWREWIDNPLTPIPTPPETPGVGFFLIEGDYYRPTGRGCLMTMTSPDYPLCPVCRQAVVRYGLAHPSQVQLVELSGELKDRLLVVPDDALSCTLALDFLGLPSGDPSARASFTLVHEEGERTRSVPSWTIETSRLREGSNRVSFKTSLTTDFVRKPASLSIFDSGTQPVCISYRNLAPSIAPIPDQAVLEETTLRVRIPGTDPNPGDRLSYRISVGSPGMRLEVLEDGVYLVWTPTILDGGQAPGGNALHPVLIEATDGHLTGSMSFTITVQDNGRPVQVTTPPEGAVRGEWGVRLEGLYENTRTTRLAVDGFAESVFTYGSAFQADLPTRDLPDGLFPFTVSAYDGTGTFLGSDTVPVTIDKTPATVTITSPQNGQAVQDPVVLAATSIEPNGQLAIFKVTAKGSGKALLQKAVAGHGPDYALDVPLPEDWERFVGKLLVYTVTVHDTAGHSGSISATCFIGTDRRWHYVK